MSDLADRTDFGVVALASGHPHNVFAKSYASNHTLGRAVDVYRLGGVVVVDGRFDGSFTHETLQWLYEREELHKVGGPWDIDGSLRRSFSNSVHQDHLHISTKR